MRHLLAVIYDMENYHILGGVLWHFIVSIVEENILILSIC